MDTVQDKIEAAKVKLAKEEGDKKRKKTGEFRRETWTEKFGWHAIIWIFAWGAAAGWGYTYAYEHYDELFATKTIVIEAAHAETGKETQKEVEVPQEPKSEAKEAEFTAYNAEEGQTDADPLTMASGKKVYEGAVANNCLPFGTKIKVNGKVKVVEDRMNSRYGCDHFDIYMTDYNEAMSFGRKTLTYEIL